MKKLSFLLGTLGGAMAGYVLSNSKLRKELMGVKDTSSAAKVLGKHLSADGQTVAAEVRELARQHHLGAHLAEGKKYARKYYVSAKKELTKFLGTQAKQATKVAKRVSRRAVRKAKSMVR